MKEKIEAIDKLLKDHSEWLKDARKGKRLVIHDDILKGANLRGADLTGANLGGADLRGANLEGADLRGTILEKSEN